MTADIGRPSGAGDDLYWLVEEYASFGHHRSGDVGDRATGRWLAEELRRRGARVELQPVNFDRYACRWEVRVDGEIVDALPLFYSGIGRFRSTAALAIVDPEPVATGPTSTIELAGCVDAAGEARNRGKGVLVFAFEHPLGLLAAPNRRPVPPAGRMPAIQVAARHREGLADASVVVDLDAGMAAGRSANVVARFGDGPLSETIVVTTPISGWFRCAGERGTGIAVALALAEALAAHRPVLFLGATGHELASTFGAALLESHVEGTPRAVVHVGANAGCTANGAGAAYRDLSAKRPLRMAGTDAEVAAVEEVLGRAGWGLARPQPATDPASWVGEASTWASRGVTLLSVIDSNPYFHTPEDLPGAVTSPAALAAVAEVLTSATVAATP